MLLSDNVPGRNAVTCALLSTLTLVSFRAETTQPATTTRVFCDDPLEGYLKQNHFSIDFNTIPGESHTVSLTFQYGDRPTLSGVKLISEKSPPYVICADKDFGREPDGDFKPDPDPMCTNNMFFDELAEDVYQIRIIFNNFANFYEPENFEVVVTGCYYCMKDIRQYFKDYQDTYSLPQNNIIDIEYNFIQEDQYGEDVDIEATISKVEILMEPSYITFTYMVCFDHSPMGDFDDCYNDQNEFNPLIMNVYRGIKVLITIDTYPSNATDVIVTINPYGCAEISKSQEPQCEDQLEMYLTDSSVFTIDFSSLSGGRTHSVSFTFQHDQTPTLSSVDVGSANSPPYMICFDTILGRETNGSIILDPDPICTENMFVERLAIDVYQIRIVFYNFTEFIEDITFDLVIYGCNYCKDDIALILKKNQITKLITQDGPINFQYNFIQEDEYGDTVHVNASISKVELLLEPSDVVFTYKICFANDLYRPFDDCYDNQNEFYPLIQNASRGIQVSLTIVDLPLNAFDLTVTVIPYGCFDYIRPEVPKISTTTIPIVTPCDALVNYAIADYSSTFGSSQYPGMFVPDVSDLSKGDRCITSVFIPLIDLERIRIGWDFRESEMTVSVQAFTLSSTGYNPTGSYQETTKDGEVHIPVERYEDFKKSIALKVCILAIVPSPIQDISLTLDYIGCALECLMPPTTPILSASTTSKIIITPTLTGEMGTPSDISTPFAKNGTTTPQRGKIITTPPPQEPSTSSTDETGAQSERSTTLATSGTTTPQREPTCQPHNKTSFVYIPDCISGYAITYNICKGYCESHSVLTVDNLMGVLTDDCECCKPAEVKEESVDISCSGDMVKTFTYQSVVTCECSSCP